MIGGIFFNDYTIVVNPLLVFSEISVCHMKVASLSRACVCICVCAFFFLIYFLSCCPQQIIMHSEYSLASRRVFNFLNTSLQETDVVATAIIIVICFFCM
jgi:hypothetical protein